MNHFHRITNITLSIIFIISSCCSKESSFNANVLNKNVWIYDSQYLPDSIKNFTDNFISFDKYGAHVNSNNIGEFTISNDTLRISQTLFVLQKAGKYQEKVNNQFIGLILEANHNQILIEKVSGYFPIRYQNSVGNFDNSEIIRLTNQKNKKKKDINFNYVSIASSSCYGTCPEFSVELDNKRHLKFKCSKYCRKAGSFDGIISLEEQRKIEDIISYLNLKNDTTIFTTPIDAPEAELRININNKEFYFYGYPGDFQNKMQELTKELFSIAEKTALKETNKKLYFKANLKILPTEKTIQFIPPILN